MIDDVDQAATYAVEEVAALKGVSYATVRNAIMRGELLAVRDGRGWRVRGPDVVVWIPQHWTLVDDDADR